jgi:hypothetical protein
VSSEDTRPCKDALADSGNGWHFTSGHGEMCDVSARSLGHGQAPAYSRELISGVETMSEVKSLPQRIERLITL